MFERHDVAQKIDSVGSFCNGGILVQNTTQKLPNISIFKQKSSSVAEGGMRGRRRKGLKKTEMGERKEGKG